MSALWTVCLKELRELSRDRRTLMLALVMGPLLTPALLFGILTLAQTRAKSQIEKPLQVAIDGANRAPELVKWLRSEEHTSELQSLMRMSYAVFCLKEQRNTQN